MLKLKNYHGKKVGILGFGISGKPLFEALKSAGSEIFLWDDNLKDEAYSKYLLPPTDVNWQEVEQLIISPGIQHQGEKAHPLLRNLSNKCEIFCDIELFYRTLDDSNKTIAVTGTNGKSTTTALICHILKTNGQNSQMGGNIGVAVSTMQVERHQSFVLELSSYQLEKLIDAHFNIAVLTNITPDHLEMHGDMESYTKAKIRIFDKQSQYDYAIVAIDNAICLSVANKLASPNIIKVSKEMILDKGISLVGGVIYDNYFSNKAVKFNQPLCLSGSHNSENIACAVAATLAYGLKLEDIIEAIASFKPLEHRLEYVGEKEGIKFVNDSKGTNFDSTKHALAAFDNIHWIAGGKAKEGGIIGFEAYIDHLKSAYLIGASQDDFATQIGTSIPYIKCDTLDNAFTCATKNAKAGDVILLSPAAASTDQWKSFEERGTAFKKLFNDFNS